LLFPSYVNSVRGGIMKYWASIRRAYSQIRDYGANGHRTYVHPRDSACPVPAGTFSWSYGTADYGGRLYRSELTLYSLISVLLFRPQNILGNH
jgi:hypothetical protein